MVPMEPRNTQLSQPQTPQQKQEHQASAPKPLMYNYKNRLQELTQKASIPPPKYRTVVQGGAWLQPMFRSTVSVDGVTYEAQNTFTHRKAAEQEAAKVALESISKKLREEGCPFVDKFQDAFLCKSIMNEFAAKMNMEPPTYTTIQTSSGINPCFVSSLVFDGITYPGEAARKKKQAEQSAACAAISAILGHSGFRLVLYETVKAKFKSLQVKDTQRISAVSKQGNVGSGVVGVHPLTRKEPEGAADRAYGQTSDEPAVGNETIHQFKKQKTEPAASAPGCLPIQCVPALEIESSPADLTSVKEN